MDREKKRAAPQRRTSPHARHATLDLFEQEFLSNQQEPKAPTTQTTSRESDALPDLDELYQRFHNFNVRYFAGKLPTPRIRYSDRLLAAGLYVRSRREIVISRKYHEVYPLEIDDTLKHEMIHLIHFNHSAAFRAEAERIGASVRAKAHPKLRLPPRYLYVCPNCGTEYPRRKRLISASCGQCSPRRFDMRYKLALKEKRT